MLAIAELEILSRAINRPLRVIELHDNKLFFIASGLAYALAIALFVVELQGRTDSARRQQQRDAEIRQRVGAK